jgi:hypothetical protein
MSLYNFDAVTGELRAVKKTETVQDLRPVQKKKLFRIAVCLSGQPRHWRTAVSNIKKFFDFTDTGHPETGIEVQTDYFIHTWDINTWRQPKTNWEVANDVAHGEIDAIVSAFEPRAWHMDTFERTEFPRAWDPMYYSNARCLMLKRDYEISNDFQYDLVVKARMDTIYDPAHRFPLARVWPMVGYTCTPISKFPQEFNYNNFDDVLFYGDSPTMDLMGDIYSTYKTLHTAELFDQQNSSMDLQPDLWYGPGCLMYEHMTNLGIHPEGARVIEYAVVRSTAVAENLDGIYDYDKIRKKWFDWYI